MTSVQGQPATADWLRIAVLCGVEALSAQQRAVGAISLCAGLIRAMRPVGQVVPNEFAKPMTVSREQG
jgi:hypothetical protein